MHPSVKFFCLLGWPQHKTADPCLVACVGRVLSGGQCLGDIDGGSRRDKQNGEEERAQDGPVQPAAGGGHAEEVESPPQADLAEVVRVTGVSPEAGLYEPLLVRRAFKGFSSSFSSVLFRLESVHLPICNRLPRQEQKEQQPRQRIKARQGLFWGGVGSSSWAGESQQLHLLEGADKHGVEEFIAPAGEPAPDLCPPVVLSSRVTPLDEEVCRQPGAPGRGECCHECQSGAHSSGGAEVPGPHPSHYCQLASCSEHRRCE
mmetsp:Transcript_33616/g.95063  ORF Transcript_33616/g.95063 Transcript_33616/m.95063 type:complete len:260 (-) Transcript_33616:156-935(-)